jgi:hypothetical protein
MNIQLPLFYERGGYYVYWCNLKNLFKYLYGNTTKPIQSSKH